MAATVPIGIAIVRAMNDVVRVPDIRGRMPKWASSKSGLHCLLVKNSIVLTS